MTINGEIEVRVPDGTKETVSIERVTLLDDFLRAYVGFDDSDSEEEYKGETGEDTRNANRVSTLSIDSADNQYAVSRNEHSHRDKQRDEQDAWKHLDDLTTEVGDAAPSESTFMDIDEDFPLSPSSPRTPSSPSTSPPPFPGSFPALSTPAAASSHISAVLESNSFWRSFAVLGSAPADHAFLSSVPQAQPNKTFLQRLNKEYRVLSSSLPGKKQFEFL